MNYKTANKVRYLGMIMGIILAGVSILIYQTEKNGLFVLGVVIEILSILVGFIFYHCPKCGHMLEWRPLNLKHCQNCGCKL